MAISKAVDVVIEQRFYQSDDGKYWTENAFPYHFWLRYLSVFEQVTIVARVQKVSTAEVNWHRVDGEKVSFAPLPFYVGLKGFMQTLPALIKSLRYRRAQASNVIFRVPGVLSWLYQLFAMRYKQKYAAEVVGDPADTFSANASKSLLRPFIRRAFIAMLKRQCKHACAISYVTEVSLQKRYPPAKQAYSTHYSSIQLQAQDYKKRESYLIGGENSEKCMNIVCIGNLAQPYKGCDFMLKTLAKLVNENYNLKLTWLGGGALLADMQHLANELHIDNYVNFVGNVSEREQIRDYLDNADVFVLCSRQEGLPRVVIEAMARSLVCVATNVGGVPELLADDFIIERDNIEQLCQQLIKLYHLSADELLAVSQQNYQKSLQYQDDVLAQRRKTMYQALLDAPE